MPTLGQPGCKTAERDKESSYSSRMDAMVPGLWALRPGLRDYNGAPPRDPCRPGLEIASPQPRQESDRSLAIPRPLLFKIRRIFSLSPYKARRLGSPTP